jgi:hypothetical protein
MAKEGEVRAVPRRHLDVVLKFLSVRAPRIPDFGSINLEPSNETVALGIPVDAQRTAEIGVRYHIEDSRKNVRIEQSAVPPGGMEPVAQQRGWFGGRVYVVRKTPREDSLDNSTAVPLPEIPADATKFESVRGRVEANVVDASTPPFSLVR